MLMFTNLDPILTSANFPSVKYLSKELFPTVLSPIKINRNWYSNIGSTMLKINYKNFFFVKMFRKLLLSTPLLKAEDNFWSSFIFTLCEHQVIIVIWVIIFTMFEHITMATKQAKTNLFVNKPRNAWKLRNMWNNIGIFVMLLQKIIILVFLLREGYSICPGDTFQNLWVCFLCRAWWNSQGGLVLYYLGRYLLMAPCKWGFCVFNNRDLFDR